MTLIGYWPLNSDTSQVQDYSGNGNHGTVNGSFTNESGPLGQKAYSFNGSNGNNIETSSFNPYTTQGVTICGWIKSSTHYTSPSVNKWFVNHYDDTDNRFGGFIGTSGNMKAYLKINGTTYPAEMSGNPLETGEWHFIVLSASDNSVRLFVDGLEKAKNNISVNISDIGSGNLYINEFKDDDNYTYELNAAYSEIRMYNRPLTPSEVQYLYNVGKRGQHVTSKKTS